MSDWIAHDGAGKCPVKMHFHIDIKFENGTVEYNTLPLPDDYWRHNFGPYNITHYRISSGIADAMLKEREK